MVWKTADNPRYRYVSVNLSRDEHEYVQGLANYFKTSSSEIIRAALRFQHEKIAETLELSVVDSRRFK